MTPFRQTQLRAVLKGSVRMLCGLARVDQVRDLLETLVYDRPFWEELSREAGEASSTAALLTEGRELAKAFRGGPLQALHAAEAPAAGEP